MIVKLREPLIRTQGPSLRAGEVVDLPDDEARRYCAQRTAEPYAAGDDETPAKPKRSAKSLRSPADV